MLIPKTYPSMLGADAPSTNSGHLSIHGWEISLGWRDQIKDFSYSVRFNISDAKNISDMNLMESSRMSKNWRRINLVSRKGVSRVT